MRQYTAGNDIEVIMDQARKNSIYRKIFLIAVIAAAAALTAIRVRFADQVGAWYPADQDFDDALLVRYADFRDHFIVQSMKPFMALVKNIGYSVFLQFVHVTGLKYTTVQSILWILNAAGAAWIVWYISDKKSRILPLFSYAFVLFTPVAFDNWCGNRLYRNGGSAPLYYLFFVLLTIIALKICKDSWKHVEILILSVLLTIVFLPLYYFKEDGIWLYLSYLAAWLILGAIEVIRTVISRRNKQAHPNPKSWPGTVLLIVILLLPVLIFKIGTRVYEDTNEKYFGVRAVNTRTEGEYGGFIQRLYRVESPNRSRVKWIPADVVDRVFEVCPTLKERDDLYWQIVNSPWFGGDYYGNCSAGDGMTWAFRIAMDAVGLYDDEKTANDFLKKVNAEIDAAFENGTLEKSTRIHLTSSMPGLTKDELKALFKDIKDIYWIHVLMARYTPSAKGHSAGPEESIAKAEELVNMELMPLKGEESKEFKAAMKLLQKREKRLFKIYKTIQPILLAMAFAGVLLSMALSVLHFIKDRRSVEWSGFLIRWMTIGFGALSFAYATAIAWFCNWMAPDFRALSEKFYSVGVIPPLNLFVLMGCTLLYMTVRSGIENRKKGK